MKNVIVIAPHPDDETLGCGGTILRHIDEGDNVYWLIITQMNQEDGFPEEKINKRNQEIEDVQKKYGFNSYHILGYGTTKLDSVPTNKIINDIGNVFSKIKPEVVYVPYRGDIHTDHKVVFDAVLSCTKWFRYGSIKRVLAYETLSETEFGINPDANSFRPNIYINISDYLEKKIEIMKLYESEIGEFPFPRSEQAIKSLAWLRGAAAGCQAAEAFMLLKEIS